MPIKFKVVAKGQPGVPGGGVKKYYANPVMEDELDLDELTESIEKICTVSGADIRAVVYALVDVATNGLGNSRIIRLSDLGSLRVSLNSEGKDTPGEVKSSSIKKASIIFTPGPRLKEMLARAKFVKEEG
jgi:predicted histone-like DNA-binding protein